MLWTGFIFCFAISYSLPQLGLGTWSDVLKGIVKKKEEGPAFVIDGLFIFLFLFLILSASKPKRS
jgi:hypothetical protein